MGQHQINKSFASPDQAKNKPNNYQGLTLLVAGLIIIGYPIIFYWVMQNNSPAVRAHYANLVEIWTSVLVAITVLILIFHHRWQHRAEDVYNDSSHLNKKQAMVAYSFTLMPIFFVLLIIWLLNSHV